MIRLIAILCIVFAGTAEAKRIPLLPPAEYDHPYKGPFEEHSLSVREVHRTCRKLTGAKKPLIRGCAIYRGLKCTIYYPNVRHKGVNPLDIRRHELAHCNGWKH